MTFSLTGFLILLLVAAICGAIGRAIAGGTRGGCLVSVAIGFIGALLGTWLARAIRLPDVLAISIEGHPFPIVWSIIGAALFVAVIHLISGRR
ncbi:MAG TPA: GlsB/YeaQ/YmgE family stress response membrane protein [Thermoanaerobaculia bacterium]|nr:GlsB/YeaQ/YmgE family stress response membrane protein [Thermoanaerobaculia bacterium]